MALWVETKEFEEIFETTISLLTAVKEQVKKKIEHKDFDDSTDDLLIKTQSLDDLKILSNLTVCLTNITSWLILNKAFKAGEIELKTLIKEGQVIADLITQQDYDEYFARNFGSEIDQIIARSRRLFGSIKELVMMVEKINLKGKV